MTGEKKGKTKPKFSFLYFILIALIVYLAASLFVKPKVEEVDYSEFLNYVKAGKVEDLKIGEETITGKFTKEVDGKAEKVDFKTTKVDDPGLVPLLNEKGVSYAGKLENTILLQLLLWLPLFVILGLFWYFMMKRMGRGPDFMSVGRSKAKIYAEDQVKVNFTDVAGVDEAEEELTEVIEFLKNPGKFQRLGGKIPKGILLVGSPGTGKTLLARAVAGEAGVPFFSISGSEFVEMFVGVGAARVRDLFSQAQDRAPCIIFIDELDALGKARGLNPTGGHDEREQTLNQLLVEMDGFDPRKGLILMSATNRPEILDPALLRPGRFDRHVLVDKPDKKGRLEILNIHSKDLVLAKNVDLEKIAAKTPGFVGADLANIANEAALLAARAGKEAVEDGDFDEAIERAVAGLEKKNRLMNQQEKERVAYHEVGHALVAANLPGTDAVEKISIVPRGLAALGYTLQLPTEDRYLMTETELKNRLATLLGGRVAEEIIFKEPSTGAHNDLMKATDIARSMVTEYGMSDKLGLVTFERERGPSFLGIGGMEGPKEHSDDTSREIDKEIRRVIDAAYDTAKRILTKEDKRLKRMAKRLLEVEVLEDEELVKLLGKGKKDNRVS
ncbi:MAG: ATP-dependent zinc metalloprotease FtsH [Deltaproteobacteria bacterium]|uniref:ATP-dependent zinc metalloprotease FtsH n=1 Tax=Candidatus Zymogenus saltonus TaxID=2844893 RepID=A0A9D8KF67_9DELT|nr:ATP-dependent zinc metalloprotease FtsH [Candidatus Zymogenus saltonus]